MSLIKGFKRFTLNLIAGINAVTIVLMLFVGMSDRIDPESHPFLSCLGLSFPVLIVVNLLFILFWVIFSFKRVIIPFVGFLICYSPIRTYCPLNRSSSEKADFTLMTYNMAGFSNDENGLIGGRLPESIDHVEESDADVVCMQEEGIEDDWVVRFAKKYPYRDSCLQEPSGNCITVLSRYPILKKTRIPFEGFTYNLAADFVLDVDGKQVHLINCHLETAGLTSEERQQFKRMMKGEEAADSARENSRLLLVKIGKHNVKRAGQVKNILQYMDKYPDESFIVCGDFNDTPISYTRHKMAERLTDCYRESGFGPGWTFHRDAIRVRIDHVLCSSDITPIDCKTDNSIASSDHYPVLCRLKIKSKTEK